MFQLLHFSDTHNNRRATGAMIEVAKRFPQAFIAVTGDICSSNNRSADPRIDGLPHPRVWIAPGNHDCPAHESMKHLTVARWRTPFVEVVGGMHVLCLTTAGPEVIEDDLSSVVEPGQGGEHRGSVVLCHHALDSRTITNLLRRLGHPSPSVPVILCHGHEHPGDFYCRYKVRNIAGHSVHDSHVYSANTRARGKLGGGHLIEVGDGGAVHVRWVDLEQA